MKYNKKQLSNEILQEYQRRASARKNYHDFILYTYPNYVDGWFQVRLAEILQQFYEDVKNKKSPRIIIQAPPRHGKSEQVSVRWPAWVFGHDPDMNFISCSHTATLAEALNRKLQSVIDSKLYNNIFPATKINSRRVVTTQSWLRNNTTFEIVNNKGVYLCAGIGGPITGSGANILLIDDPVKNSEDAASVKKREGTFEWYQTTASTRVAAFGGIIVTQTRWHEDDLSGKLLRHNPEDWTVYNFPAIAEEDDQFRKIGDALHPDRWPLSQLDMRKKELGSRHFAALYQGNPKDMEGGLFQKKWFPFVRAHPILTQVCRYWDRAGTTNKKSDWTCGVKMGVTTRGEYYIIDVVRFKGTPMTVQNSIVNTATQDGTNCTVYLEQDPGQAGISEVNSLIRALSGFIAKSVLANKSKSLRANPFSAQCEAGNVSIVQAHWNETLIDELEYFPNGDHDDQVDACSGAFNQLVQFNNLNFNKFVEM